MSDSDAVPAPIKCSSCGSSRDSGFGPCPSCGALRGEDNRCGSCQAIAGLREVAPATFVCLACGAPRSAGPHSHVSLDFVGELESRARMARLTSRIMYGFAGMVGLGTLLVTGVTGLASIGAALLPLLLGGGVTVGGALFARSRSSAALADDAMALERRVLQALRAAPGGVTVEAATRVARQAQPVVDAALTDLARRALVDMDVDDEGRILYRVAEGQVVADGELDDGATAGSAARRDGSVD